MTRSQFAVILSVALCAIACSDSSSPSGELVGPSGGEVESPDCGAVLVIPPGALSESVRISVTQVTDGGSDDSIIGNICSVGPPELSFDEPALLSFNGIPPAPDGTQNIVSMGSPGAWTDLRSVAVDTVATAEIPGAGTFAARGVDALPQLASTCPGILDDFTACGGPEVGTYAVESFCFSDVPFGADAFRGECPDATVEVSIDVPGETELLLDGSDLTLNYGDLSLLASLTFPLSCALGEPCAAFGCEDDGSGSCRCDLADSITEAGSISTSYTVEGSDLATDGLGMVPFCATEAGIQIALDVPEELSGLVGGASTMIAVASVRDVPPSCDALDAGFQVECPPDATCQSVLSNGDFESADPVAGSQPDEPGGWEGDLAGRVAELEGIAACGGQMMQWQGTRPGGSSGMDVLSTVAQVVDLRPHVDFFGGGGVVAEASALVNRVAGDDGTDREFRMFLYFSDSVVPTDPADEPAAAIGTAELIQPGWQRLRAGASVPRAARSMAIRIQAVEDVQNGGFGSTEFDGHVIDAVRVVLHDTDGPLPAAGGFEVAAEPLVLDLEREPAPTPGLGSSDGWSGDVASFVGTENGISPRSGRNMMRFLSTTEESEATAATQSQVYRVVPVPGGVRPLGGGVTARIESFVNRVPGIGLADTEFLLVAYAFPGPVLSEPTGIAEALEADQQIAVVEATIFTDPDPMSWQLLAADLVLPPETAYIAFYIAAVEDVLNNDASVDPLDEFEGHYADDFRITWLRPAP